MKKYKIEYINMAGEIRHTTVMANNPDEAESNAYKEETSYSNDNIHQIISVEEE